MNEFRTIVRVNPVMETIGLQSKLITMGSCFADAIGERLKRFKFQALVNPFGVIYNPISIHKAIGYAIHNKLPAEHSYLQHHQINYNYDFHSELSAIEKGDLTEIINNRIATSHHFLTNTKWLFITYGTAWVYAKTDTREIVANCHKMPSEIFTKTLLGPEMIIDSFTTLYNDLIAFNPDIKIILTLSPVRHIKDTLELNSVSKSVLRVACHSITENFRNVEYFPAFEMMMDDLRDYRFYKSDMLHPSEDAEGYIWDKFAFSYFTDETKNFLKQWTHILSALSHKPFHPGSPGHQNFVRETMKKIEHLTQEINVSEELEQLRSQLK